jgi:hypothetical protein
MTTAPVFLASDSKTGYSGACSFAKHRRSGGNRTHFYLSFVVCAPSRQCCRSSPAFSPTIPLEMSMNLKLVVAVSLFAAVPAVAFAQKDAPATKVPKPTIADAQKLVQTVSGDKAKLQAYCDMGKVQDQMEQAEKKKDNKALEALGAKADSLAQQIGPEYAKVMDGLEEVDPNSAEGKQYTAVFATLIKQCK